MSFDRVHAETSQSTSAGVIAGSGAAERDMLFRADQFETADFDFGAATASVFDDMLHRSIPHYSELQRMLGEIANEFGTPGSNVYDLGCSTGITLQTISRATPTEVNLIGVDNSNAMLARAREKFSDVAGDRAVEFICADLNEAVVITNASLVILNLTLQFVRPLYRGSLLRNIHAGLNDQGCLILVEKVLGNDSLFNRLFIDFYYRLKRRNGYSEMEIARKREALENVLIPYRVDENIELLRNSGFAYIEVFFKWYNFCGLVAVKAN